MRRIKQIIALIWLTALLLGLAACAEQPERALFLPESQNDELLVFLPEKLPADWQWIEDWQTADDVPRLLLAQGDEVIEPAGFSRSWSCAEPGTDMMKSYVACGMHPLESNVEADMPRLAGGADAPAVQLVWQTAPTEVSLTAYAFDEWQQRKCGNTLPDEILHSEIELAEDGSFALLADEHSYVYVIGAKWQNELAAEAPELSGLGGNGVWAFYVE